MQFSPGDRRLQKRAGNIWNGLQRVKVSTWYDQVILHFMSAGSGVPENTLIFGILVTDLDRME
jgi:hypothetical protein